MYLILHWNSLETVKKYSDSFQVFIFNNFDDYGFQLMKAKFSSSEGAKDGRLGGCPYRPPQKRMNCVI